MKNFNIVVAVEVYGRKTWVRLEDSFTDWDGEVKVVSGHYQFPIWKEDVVHFLL